MKNVHDVGLLTEALGMLRCFRRVRMLKPGELYRAKKSLRSAGVRIPIAQRGARRPVLRVTPAKTWLRGGLTANGSAFVLHHPDVEQMEGLSIARSLDALTDEDLKDLQREAEEGGLTNTFRELERMSRPTPWTLTYNLTMLMAVGACVSGSLGFLCAMVLSLRASDAHRNVIGFGVVAALLMGLAALLALSDVWSSVWGWFARQAERGVPLAADFGPFPSMYDLSFQHYIATGTFDGHDRGQIDAVAVARNASPSVTWLFLTQPSAFLARTNDGLPRTPLQALKDGDYELVLKLARGEAEP